MSTEQKNRQWGRDGDEQEIRDRHTVAVDPTEMSWWGDTRRPTTDLEALMLAAPGNEPVESAEGLQERLGPLRDALEDDTLTDKERFVVELMFFSGKSTREVSAMLPWSSTQIHRIKHEALRKLRVALEGNY